MLDRGESKIMKQDDAISLRKSTIIFWTIAILYGIVWSILPAVLEYNFRYDIIEMFFVGKEGVVSTFKHPALNSAVLEMTYQLLGKSDFAPYLLAQICFLITAWTVWRLGREFLTPGSALLGALTFYAYWGYFYKSLYYNHNVVLFPAWGCLTLFAFWALKHRRLKDWIFLGIVIGVGVQCKYTLLILVASVLIFMAIDSDARKNWLKPGPYLTTAVAFVIALPQFIWLLQSDFSCLQFPVMEHGLEKTLGNRLYSVCNDGIIALPLFMSSALVLLLPVLGFRWRLRSVDGESRFARNYLIAMVFMPWLLQLVSVFSAATPMEYGNYMQIFIFFGPLLLISFQTKQDRIAVRRAGLFFSCVMIGYFVGYGIHVYNSYFLSGRNINYMFPGRELAEKAEKIWHEHYDIPLPYTTGGWWYAGNVAIYGKDRPTVHCTNNSRTLEPNFPLSNWSTNEQVMRYGGLVFWDANRKWQDRLGERDPLERLHEQYPMAQPLETIVLNPVMRGMKNPYRVGVALVPPNETIEAKPFEPAPLHFYYP